MKTVVRADPRPGAKTNQNPGRRRPVSPEMNLPSKAKKRPAGAQALRYSAFQPGPGSTLQQVTELISVYTHIDPVLPEYTVGSLVPDLDLLGADINEHWGLKGAKAFWAGEIEATWTVFYLAGYIDLKK